MRRGSPDRCAVTGHGQRVYAENLFLVCVMTPSIIFLGDRNYAHFCLPLNLKVWPNMSDNDRKNAAEISSFSTLLDGSTLWLPVFSCWPRSLPVYLGTGSCKCVSSSAVVARVGTKQRRRTVGNIEIEQNITHTHTHARAMYHELYTCACCCLTAYAPTVITTRCGPSLILPKKGRGA